MEVVSVLDKFSLDVHLLRIKNTNDLWNNISQWIL